MNTRIFSLVMENLQQTFNLPKYQGLILDKDSVVRYTSFYTYGKNLHEHNERTDIEF